MLTTLLCDLLEIRYPIIQGGMGPNETSDLAIAVCQAGGLGTISANRTSDPYGDARTHIQKVKEHTTSTFGVNQVIKGSGAAERIRAVLDEREADPDVRRRLKVVITSGGDPRVFAPALRESGVLHIHVVPTVYHASKAVQAGCSAVIAEGYESGGHVGYEAVHSMVLIPAVVQTVSVPVIAAGGFSDGRGLAAALALGAAGIQMGTRFYMSREANFAHPAIHEALLEARETDTTIIPGVYGPNRSWKNPFVERLKQMVAAGASHEEIQHAKAEGEQARYRGDRENSAVPIGMVVGRIDQLKSVREIMESTVTEAEHILKNLPRLIKEPVV